MSDMGHNSQRVTADELRQFVERFERLEAEKKSWVKPKHVAMTRRKRDADDIAEEEAVLSMYCEALGMMSTEAFFKPNTQE